MFMQIYLVAHNNIYDSLFYFLFIVYLLSMTIVFIQANSSPTDNMPKNIEHIYIYQILKIWKCTKKFQAQVAQLIKQQRNLFEILLNQTEIMLNLLCTDWFGTANGCPIGTKSIGKR